MKEQTLKTRLDSALRERDAYRVMLNEQRAEFKRKVEAMRKLVVLHPAVERAES